MSALFALLLSLVAPGAGQIYLGFFTEGIVIGILFALGKSALLPLVLRAFGVTTLRRTLQIFYGCNLGYMALICYAALSSFWRGVAATQTNFLYAVLFAVMVTLVYKNTLNPFIFTALSGRSGVYEILRANKKSTTKKK